ncbi:hypothetical protein [Rhodoblastus sp.]|uniref:hypothetical protein n=1 Tax=Rhodoblastus sp. TaxID=1962975 RepID=UPI003F9B9944
MASLYISYNIVAIEEVLDIHISRHVLVAAGCLKDADRRVDMGEIGAGLLDLALIGAQGSKDFVALGSESGNGSYFSHGLNMVAGRSFRLWRVRYLPAYSQNVADFLDESIR